MIGRAVKGACNGGQGVLPADVACPPLYAHKNKFQDFIMPMYLSLSMCAQWTVLRGERDDLQQKEGGRLHLLFEFEFVFVFVPKLCLIFCKCSIE